MRASVLSALVALASVQLSAAQTSTLCDPTKKTCPADPALGKTVSIDFTKGSDPNFFLLQGTSLKYGSNGAEFVNSKETDAPTIESEWYIFFGKIEVVAQAATGQGIVSSFVLQSDDLDEVDWEWLGGDLTQVQSNYFGKGNTTTYDRGAYHPVAAPQSQFHTYTLDWTAERLTWAIDNVVVRTLKYGDANGGQNYPQTPMKVKVGSWCAGSSTAPAGTVQWAGGLTDFSKGPYSMFIKSVTVQDYTTSGSEYVYSDLTGSWQSIKVNGAAGGAAISSGSVSSSSTATKSSSAASSSGTKASTVTSASSTLATSTQTATSGAESNTKPIGNAPTATTTTSNGPTVTLATQTSSAASTSSTAKASGNAAAKRYGALDYSVIGLGLGLGYLVM